MTVSEGGELDVSKGGNVWREVEDDEVSLQDLREVERDYD
jgi:hypothetical protein